MSNLVTVLRLARADVFERTRRYSFLITLGFALYAAYIFVPPANSSYTTVTLGGHRGIYNSAWIGTMVAMMTNAFLSLAGFYLVKNSIRRDVTTRVGQVIAASPVSSFTYLAAKWLSNFSVLAAIVAVLSLVAGVMQIVRGEVLHIEFLKLIAPFVIVSLPMMAVVAAIAVLFESVAFLSGGLGNVIFFVLWMTSITPAGSEDLDLFGFRDAISSMEHSAARNFSDYDLTKKQFSLGFSIKSDGETYTTTTYVWEGVEWSSATLLRRGLWLVIAGAIVSASALLFGRFDNDRPSGDRPEAGSRRRARKKERALKARTLEDSEHGVTDLSIGQRGGHGGGLRYADLTALVRSPMRLNVVPLIDSEFRLMLKGVSRWWLFVAAGLIVLGATLPMEAVREFFLPITFVWPILLWSPLGSRESSNRTEQFIFTTPHPVTRQYFAMWAAGVLLAVIVGSGIGIRFAIGGEWQNLLCLAVGAVCIPSFALTCGVWTGSGKMFEILYLILWYMGPMSKFPELDFLGATAGGVNGGHAVRFIVVALVLVVIGLSGRKKQALQY